MNTDWLKQFNDESIRFEMDQKERSIRAYIHGAPSPTYKIDWHKRKGIRYVRVFKIEFGGIGQPFARMHSIREAIVLVKTVHKFGG